MKRLLVVFWVMAALSMLRALPSEATPFTYGGIQYELVNFEGQSWDAATADAAVRLGNTWHLAAITSQDIQNMVYANLVAPAGGSEYWLGGYQSPITETVPNKGWTWISGAAWSFTNWSGSEPNDFYGPGSEQYLGMQVSGLWNDEGNLSLITGYIASSPVPEPGTLMLLGAGMFGLALFGKRRSNAKAA
jgi:hypothetical protein